MKKTKAEKLKGIARNAEKSQRDADGVQPVNPPEEHYKNYLSGKARAFRTQFAADVKATRESAGLTVAVLAEKAGIARRYLYEIESGEKGPSLEIAHQIGVALDRTFTIGKQQPS